MFVEMRHSRLPKSRGGLNYSGKEETTEDRPRAGGPLSAVCEKSVSYVHEFLRDDACSSIEDISRYNEVSTGSVYRILKEHLGIRKVCARWVPYSLS